MQFAGVDSSSPPVIDIPRQCMELLDLEKPAPDACAEPRLGQVAEQEWPGCRTSAMLKPEGFQQMPAHADSAQSPPVSVS